MSQDTSHKTQDTSHKLKIGVIGYGNMGSAIAERIKTKYQLRVYDKDVDKIKNLVGIKVSGSIKELADNVDIIILAVKPQDFEKVLKDLSGLVEKKLIISIAAGIETGYIERILSGARVVRAMPNIGAKIGHSVTCLCEGKSALPKDLKVAEKLFQFIGKTLKLHEDMMNAATAISGSGPGYYFDRIETRPREYSLNEDKFQKDFIRELIQAAKRPEVGFNSRAAKFLAHWTVVFCDILLDEAGSTAQELRQQVTSKGGTTEAALEVLHRGGSLVDAVKAAVKRAKELSKS